MFMIHSHRSAHAINRPIIISTATEKKIVRDDWKHSKSYVHRYCYISKFKALILNYSCCIKFFEKLLFDTLIVNWLCIFFSPFYFQFILLIISYSKSFNIGQCIKILEQRILILFFQVRYLFSLHLVMIRLSHIFMITTSCVSLFSKEMSCHIKRRCSYPKYTRFAP